MVEIRDIRSSEYPDFKKLNLEWIEKYFKVEASDTKVLENPQSEILEKGGAILVALYNDAVVGTCALIKKDASKYELAKMAVSPKHQGLKIGYKLGQGIIDRATELGAKSIFLETNSSLTPAINLYKKLGFLEKPKTCSDYDRCNVQMDMELS